MAAKKKAAKPLPYTKAELSEARRVMRLYRTERLNKIRVRRQRYVIRRRDPLERRYATFSHDMHVLLPAVARELLRNGKPIETVGEECAAAADRMQAAIDARRPPDDDNDIPIRRRGRHYQDTPEQRWWRWQELYDELIHKLSERTELSATAVINRAIDIADGAVEILEERRNKLLHLRALPRKAKAA